MKKIIINADDLGYSLWVNGEIERCIVSGVVTSSTLMANAPGFKDGVRIAKQYPHISIGVHLNLVEFAPLTNLEIFRKHGIVGGDGNFIEGAIFAKSIDAELKQAIFDEWDAQITKIEEEGVVLSHADSHQHTHTISALNEILCQVLDKHNIIRVRRNYIPSIRLMLFGNKNNVVKLDKSKAIKQKKHNFIYRKLNIFVVKYKKRRWNHYMKNIYTMTDAFYALRNFYYDYHLLSLDINSSIIELMCHPGHPAFQNETNILSKLHTWLPKDFMLINYNDIN